MRGGGAGVGEIRALDRAQRAGGDGERAVEGIGAAVRADDVAVSRPRHGADDGSALACCRRTPGDREAGLCPRCRVGGEPNMIGPVGTGHRCPQEAYGPPVRRAASSIVPNDRTNFSQAAERAHTRTL